MSSQLSGDGAARCSPLLSRFNLAVMDAIEVLAGSSPPDLTWRVMAGGSDTEFSSMIEISRSGRTVAGSGMAGPKLYPNSVINEFRGRTDDLPYVVLARTAPHIDRVVATTDAGSEIELPLSEVIFGLRFGAALLPDGEGPASIRAEHDGVVVEVKQQPMHRRRP